MAINKVVYDGTTLLDLSADTLVSAEQLLKDIIAHGADGSRIVGTLEAASSGGTKIAYGTVMYNSATSSTAITHNLGVVPKLVLYYLESKIPTSGGLLFAVGTRVDPDDTSPGGHLRVFRAQLAYSSSKYTITYDPTNNDEQSMSYRSITSTTILPINKANETTFSIYNASSYALYTGKNYFWIAVG